MICFLVGLHKAALKPANYDKLLIVVQDKNENLCQFLQCLTKAQLQYTDFRNPRVQIVSHDPFLFPDLPLHWV